MSSLSHINDQAPKWPGKRVGEVLRALLEVVTDDPELNTREALLERLRALQ